MRVETIGDATLYLADCREVLPGLKGLDAIITDPPYGLGKANGIGGAGFGPGGRWKRKPKTYAGSWDNVRPDPEVFAALLEAARQHVIWGGNYFSDLLPVSGRWLFWDKMNSMPTYSDGEMAWTSLPGTNVKKFTRCNNGPSSNRDGPRDHPTQKPVDLMEWCLGFVPGANVICDPFMGSGSTGVACMNLDRRFIGIEREELYFDASCRRLERALLQPRLFAEPVSRPVQDSMI